MKKGLFVFGMAIAALTGCTQSEVLDVADSRAIGFDAFVGKPTRADVTNADFESFWVFGSFNPESTNWTPFYTNINVSKGGASSTWTPEKLAYWTVGKDHRFGAYADGTAKLNTTDAVTFNPSQGTSGQLSFKDYSVGDNDLVAAISTNYNWNGSNDAPTVGFTFKHLLSKVEFVFTSDASDLYTMKVTNIKITGNGATTTPNNPTKKASCDYTGAENTTWTVSSGDGATGNYDYGNLDNCLATPVANSVVKYVIPQSSDLKLSFDIEFKINNSSIASKTGVTASLKTTDISSWESGKVYKYTVKLNPNQVNPSLKVIEFNSISVDNWGTPIEPGTQPTPVVP